MFIYINSIEVDKHESVDSNSSSSAVKSESIENSQSTQTKDVNFIDIAKLINVVLKKNKILLSFKYTKEEFLDINGTIIKITPNQNITKNFFMKVKSFVYKKEIDHIFYCQKPEKVLLIFKQPEEYECHLSCNEGKIQLDFFDTELHYNSSIMYFYYLNNHFLFKNLKKLKLYAISYSEDKIIFYYIVIINNQKYLLYFTDVEFENSNFGSGGIKNIYENKEELSTLSVKQKNKEAILCHDNYFFLPTNNGIEIL